MTNDYFDEGSTSRLYKINYKNDYAIKKIPYDDGTWEGNMEPIIESFKKEIRFYKNVKNYDNIVKFYEANDKNEIILEYVTNGTIYENLEIINDKDIKFKWIKQLGNTLEYIHSLGYAHGDLNLSNILLDNNYNIKLCDFGKSYILNEIPLIGSIPYSSPELAKNESKDPLKCDVYAYGIIICFILDGFNVFNNIQGFELLEKIKIGIKPSNSNKLPFLKYALCNEENRFDIKKLNKEIYNYILNKNDA